MLSFGVPRAAGPSAPSPSVLPHVEAAEAEALFEQRRQTLELTLSASGLLSDDDEEPPQRSRRRPSSRSREARGLHASAYLSASASSVASIPSASSVASIPSVASTPSRRPFRTAKARLEAEPVSPPVEAEAAAQEAAAASPPVESIEESDELDRFWGIMSRRRLSFVEAAALRSADVVTRLEYALAAANGEYVDKSRVEAEARAQARAEARAEASRLEVERRIDEGEEDERESPWSLLCGRAPRDAAIASRACGRSMAMALYEEGLERLEAALAERRLEAEAEAEAAAVSGDKDFGERFEEYARMLDEVDFGEPLPASASPWRAVYGSPS